MDIDLTAPLTENERIAQIEASIIQLEQEVQANLKIATDLHNAYYQALEVSTKAQEKAELAQAKADKLKVKAEKLQEKAMELHRPHIDKLNEVVTAQENLQAWRERLAEVRSEIETEKKNQPVVTIDMIDEQLGIKSDGVDIRTEKEIEIATEIKLWMIENPLNAAIVFSILQHSPLDSNFFRSLNTEGSTVRHQYAHLVRLVDATGHRTILVRFLETGEHRTIKTVHERLVFILRTKASEF